MKYSKATLVLAISIFLLLAGSFPPALPAEVIRIMAANLTSGSSQSYEEPGIRIFQALKPDVVLIQEFKYGSGTLRQFVDRAFGTGYHYMVEPGGQSLPNGIISRWPILSSGDWYDKEVGDRDFAWAVIDIPGEKHLQVVSVHLYASGSATDRDNEAKVIKTQVAANFDPDHYIVVGGDLNTNFRGEAAIATFDTFLNADTHTPSDRFNNSDTNENRNKPYDWVMPNAELDQYHTTLYVGSNNRAYPEGIVFDSHVYPDLNEVYPVQYPDSHVIGMQHMAVMKAYDIPVVIPDSFMINEGFTGHQLGVRPAGWTYTYCNYDSDTYLEPENCGAAPPSIRLSQTGAAVATRSFSISGDEQLYFWAKLNFGSGADALKLEEFREGGWREIATITDLPSTGRDFGPYPVNRAATQIRFSFNKDDKGLCALDDIRITGPARPNPPWNGDYNGNRRSDQAIFRPASGLWAVRGITRVYFGSSGDQPVFGDYSGEGTACPAIFRGSSGLWSVRGVTRMYFGGSGDIPVRGDYDGSGFCRAAIYRPAAGMWAVRGLTRVYFGGPGDIPAPGYYGPENRAAFAIFRPATGIWAVRGVTRFYFGSVNDTPIPGDYTLTGKWSPAIFRPSTGLWSVSGSGRTYFGGSGDSPIPGNYAGEDRDRIAIFRRNTGVWAILGLNRTYFGKTGDVPVTR